MSLDAFIPPTPAIQLAGKPVALNPITIRGIMRLAKLLDTVKADIGMTYGDFAKVELTGAGIAALVGRIFEACVASIDLDHPQLSGTPLRVFTEMGTLLGVTVDDLLDADINEVYTAVAAFWEVNGNGPLGQRVRATTASLTPTLTTAMELVTLNFRRALIAGPRAGGTDAGGTIASSPPSTDGFVGPSASSSTSFPPAASSAFSPPSATSPDSKPPVSSASEAETPAEVALEASAETPLP